MSNVVMREHSSDPVPLSYVAITCDLVHPPGDTRRTVLVLSAYFDASHDPHKIGHSKRRSDVFALCGWVADADGWTAFHAAWSAALGHVGLSHFSAANFEFGAGEFIGWTEEQKSEALALLLPVIRDYADLGVCASVDETPYKWILVHALKAGQGKSIFRDPYAFCMQVCMENVAQYVGTALQLPEGERIACIFDTPRTAQEERRAKQAYGRLLIDKRWEALFHVVPQFEDSKRFTPLQAADLLAYETFRHVSTFEPGMLPPYPSRPIMKWLLENKRPFGGHRNEEEIEAVLRRLLGQQ